MKKNILLISISLILVSSCISLPKETVQISEVIGQDLVILQKSHRMSVQLYYRGIKDNINSFIDEVYAPWVINYVLTKQMRLYKEGNESLFGVLAKAADTSSTNTVAMEAATNELIEFNSDAFSQIEQKRRELLQPVESQELLVLAAVDKAYSNVIYGNMTLTTYLQSARKVKEAQQEALNLVGLEGIDETITDKLVMVSDQVEQLVGQGKQIDIKSSKAKKEIEGITGGLKEIFE